MPKNLKQLSESEVRLTGGHRLCPGCGEPIAVRQVLMGTEDPVIVVSATGCTEVSTTIFPYTAWACPWLMLFVWPARLRPGGWALANKAA